MPKTCSVNALVGDLSSSCVRTLRAQPSASGQQGPFSTPNIRARAHAAHGTLACSATKSRWPGSAPAQCESLSMTICP
eukprot:12608190-Heterocapsa_arctica.AAC.1